MREISCCDRIEPRKPLGISCTLILLDVAHVRGKILPIEEKLEGLAVALAMAYLIGWRC